VHVVDQQFSGHIYGPVAGTVYADTTQNSFNSFASQQPNGDLRNLVARLHEQVADLVGGVKETSPEEAEIVADILAGFTDEAGKDRPNRLTLRVLGGGLVDAEKKFAAVAMPVSTAVIAALKIFDISAL
jgi:hypothetical protein